MTVLIQVIGSVALMLWGIRLVRTGIMRAFGGTLKNFLGMAIDGRFSSFFVGLGVTIFLQSSTATALIVSSFAAKGLVQTSAALAVMLGADVGTSISAQILSFDVSWLAYAVLFAGFFLHARSTVYERRQIGRALLGLGLVLLALSLIRASSEPLRSSEILIYILNALKGEPLLTLLIMAFVTWLVHSSLAVVLLTASLAASGVVPLEVGVVMILGANIGGTVPPIIATMNVGVQGQRVAVGNALFKLTACLALLPFLDLVTLELQKFEFTGQLLVHMHALFNFTVALLFLPWVGTVAKLLERFMPDTDHSNNKSATRYLDKELIHSPALALTNASRELFRMNEQVEDMLVLLQGGISTNSALNGDASKELNKQVAATTEELKFYLSEITREEISEADSLKAMSLLLLSTNLWHVSDLVANAVDLCVIRTKEQVQFSNDGTAELLEMLALIRQGLQLLLSATLQNDTKMQKAIQKMRKEMERLVDDSRLAHFNRLSEGAQSSISTSSLHSELLRDFSRIFHHIFAASKVGI